MEEECPICRINFDLDQRTPMSLCPEQHLCCLECVNQILQTQHKPSCPECRHPLKSRNIRKFRYFEVFSQKLLKLKLELEEGQRQRRRLQQILEQKGKGHLLRQVKRVKILPKLKKTKVQNSKNAEILKQILHVSNEENSRQSRASLREKVERYLNKEDYRLAIILLMSTIEKDPSCYEQIFVGLGCKEQQYSFCEDKNYQWYKRRYHNVEISFEDLLALCFLKDPDYGKQKQWYRKMTQNFPSNNRMWLGLAITYHNWGDLTRALQIYLRLIEKEPQNSQPYEMVAFIYFAKKEIELANKYANLCLEIQPNNIFALYASAISNQIQPKTAWKQLLQVLICQPTFKRAHKALFNSIKSNLVLQIKSVIRQSILKNFDITYSKENPAFGLAIRHFQKERYRQCTLTLLKLMIKINPHQSIEKLDHQSIKKLDQSSKLLGCAYFMLEQYELSFKYISSANKGGQTNLYLGLNHFIMTNYEEAIRSIKTCLQYYHNNEGQKEISKQHITVLYRILYYSSNALMNHDQAESFYKIWANRYYSEDEIIETQLALSYWKRIFDVNRSADETKELQSKIDLIMRYQDSWSFFYDILTQ